ncbi:anti-sigma factor [Gordonia sp. DT30]|uniref:anti-sigma factor n=1 Tax=unclassified Gordonia (in: high G+C Gram-positive bacteria) TaxID=2657482 RepID=UPI003CF0C63B
MGYRGTTDAQVVIGDLLHASGAPVELAVVAESDRLSIVRSVIERALFLDDWTVDDVADVKIAVDEISSQIISATVSDGRLQVSLRIGPTGALARVSGTVVRGFDIDTDGFGWRVVTTVTDAQAIDYTDHPDRRDIVVTIGKCSSARQ